MRNQSIFVEIKDFVNIHQEIINFIKNRILMVFLFNEIDYYV